MKKTLLASACVLLLSTGGAFAQMQPAPGASSEGNAGPGANAALGGQRHSPHSCVMSCQCSRMMRALSAPD